MTEATEILAQASHTTITYNPIPEPEARKLLGKAGKPDWLIDVLMQLFAAFGSGAANLTVDTVEKMLGRAPTSFEQFAANQGGFR